MMRKTFLTISATAFLLISLTALAKAQELPPLRQQMPYAQARERLLDAGWQAMYISPMQRDQPVSGIVDYIANELGYGEVVDCAGTGLGLCRFEFNSADNRRLIVITANNEPGMEPILFSWSFE